MYLYKHVEREDLYKDGIYVFYDNNQMFINIGECIYVTEDVGYWKMVDIFHGRCWRLHLHGFFQHNKDSAAGGVHLPMIYHLKAYFSTLEPP